MEGKSFGILKKVQTQLEEWEYLGAEVKLLNLSDHCFYDSKLRYISGKKTFLLKKKFKGSWWIAQMLSVYFMLFLNKNKYDLIYMRSQIYMPFSSRAFKRKNKLIAEVNSYDLGEYKNTLPSFTYFYNKLTRNFFYSSVDSFVFISKEIEEYFKKFKKPSVTIGNGVRINKSVFVKDTQNSKPKICFVGGSEHIWTGKEKFVWLAKQLPKFNFFIIGQFEGKNTENLNYLPLMKTEELHKFLETCDLGVCTLALHTNNMQEASPLKSREYLSFGLPIIYAYEDTDLNGSEPFALRIPNTESNVQDCLVEIREFIYKAFRNSELRLMAKKFAETTLDVTIKEKKRFKFFKSTISG